MCSRHPTPGNVASGVEVHLTKGPLLLRCIHHPSLKAPKRKDPEPKGMVLRSSNRRNALAAKSCRPSQLIKRYVTIALGRSAILCEQFTAGAKVCVVPNSS